MDLQYSPIQKSGIGVIVGGIETVEELRALRELGTEWG